MSLDTWTELIRSRCQTGPVTLPDDAAPRLEKLEGIRAVIFDVYGTLFSSGVGDISLATEQNRDTELKATLSANGIQLTANAAAERFDDCLHAHIHAHQSIRKDAGIEFPEVEIREVWVDFIQTLVGDGLIEKDFEADIETLVIDYESRVNPTQAMPALENTLSALHQRGQVLGIISNAQFYTPLLFDTYLGKDLTDFHFDDAINVWSYKQLEGKPSQALYRLSAERLKATHKIEPHEVLYIGNDMRNDIWPANEVGFKTALFAGDTLSLRRRKDHPNCADLVADLEITSLAQISECI